MSDRRSCEASGGRAGGVPHSNEKAVCMPIVDGDDDGNAMLEAEVEEEVERAKPLPTPQQPAKSEYDDHQVTHCPYRPWCRHCVEGRGQ